LIFNLKAIALNQNQQICCIFDYEISRRPLRQCFQKNCFKKICLNLFNSVTEYGIKTYLYFEKRM